MAILVALRAGDIPLRPTLSTYSLPSAAHTPAIITINRDVLPLHSIKDVILNLVAVILVLRLALHALAGNRIINRRVGLFSLCDYDF